MKIRVPDQGNFEDMNEEIICRILLNWAGVQDFRNKLQNLNVIKNLNTDEIQTVIERGIRTIHLRDWSGERSRLYVVCVCV